VTGAIVFLQRRGHRAGAQSCLLRLLRQAPVRALNPVVVTGEDAWLSRECAREGIACLVEPFPSSRSLTGRLFKNALFAGRVANRLRGKQIVLVHGNDHLESLLTIALGKAVAAKTALFLRSSAMTQDDFVKYRCAGHPLLAAVGEDLRDRVRAWAPGLAVELIHDGLEPGDFLPAKPPPAKFPERILVIGSALDQKGWREAAQALEGFPGVTLTFTGGKPEFLPENPYRTFLGRTEKFQELVRGFDLAINPSWRESFGMAALEVLAAGVPLFSTRCGVIEQVITDDRWLAKPRDVSEMTQRLRALAAGWPSTALDVAGCQHRIREKFTVERTAQKLLAAYGAIRIAG